MSHQFLSLLVLTTAFSPVPKDKKPVYYTATAVGDRREYRADGKVTHVTVVSKVEATKDGLLVTEQPYRRLLVTTDAIVILDMDPPLTLLRPRSQPGDKWEWVLKQTGLTFKYTFGGTETIEVPAGKFNAVRIEEVDNKGGARTLWYAPNVGEVKVVVNAGPGKGEIRVLHVFTPCKE